MRRKKGFLKNEFYEIFIFFRLIQQSAHANAVDSPTTTTTPGRAAFGSGALARACVKPLLDATAATCGALRATSTGSPEWRAAETPLAQQLRILHSLCAVATRRHVASPRALCVIFEAVRWASLPNKIVAMRLLRQLLPHIDPRTLSQYEHAQLRRVKALRKGETPPELSPTEREFVFDDIGTPADDIVLNRGIVGTLQQLIGITFEVASSHASRYRFQDVDPVGGVGTCPENGQAGVRCEFTYPGSTLLRGGFGTPDFEGTSFSPDGRLHMVTGQQSSCPTYTTTPNDEDPAIQIGDEGAHCLEVLLKKKNQKKKNQF